MSSSAVVGSEKRGILSKIERMNEFFGGWHSLLRGRNGRNKKLKKDKKLASEKRLPSFGREFRGRLMLEPLEERIVPAVVNILVDPGEFAILNFTEAGEGARYGIIANAGATGGAGDGIWVEIETDPDVGAPDFPTIDRLIAIHAVSDRAEILGAADDDTFNTYDTIVLTNIRVPLIDDKFIDPNDGTPDTGDQVNFSIATGVNFEPGADGMSVLFGGRSFTLADDADGVGAVFSAASSVAPDITGGAAVANRLNLWEETNAHASNLTGDPDDDGTPTFAVDGNITPGNLNFVPRTSISGVSATTFTEFFGTEMAGIDTRIAGDDLGDILGDIRLENDEILGSATGTGINVRGGSILGDGDTAVDMITAGWIGKIYAKVDIGGNGDGENISATATTLNFGFLRSIVSLEAGRDINLGATGTGDILAPDGLGPMTAGRDILVGDVDGNADNDAVGAVDTIKALGGNIIFETISTETDGNEGPTGANGTSGSLDPSIADILAKKDILTWVSAGATGVLTTQPDIESGGSLGKMIAGAIFDSSGNFDPTKAPIIGVDGGVIGDANTPLVVRAEGEGGLVQGPGGVHGLFIWEGASSASPLFQLMSGEDTNDDDLVDTGIVYSFVATRNAPLIKTTPVTAAVLFNIGTLTGPIISWDTPEMAVVALDGTDARTDLRVTTRRITTESYSDFIGRGLQVLDSNFYYNDNPIFQPINNVAALPDSNRLIDLFGIDIDKESGASANGPPYFPDLPVAGPYNPGEPNQSSLPNSADGGAKEADVRNILLETNLGVLDGSFAGSGGDIDFDNFSSYDFNEPTDLGDINSIFIVGAVVDISQIDAESVQAWGTSAGDATFSNVANMRTALNSSLYVIERTEVQDIIIISQRDLPGTSFLTENPGAALYYNTLPGAFPRPFDGDVAGDYNNTLYIGAPPVDSSYGIVHVGVDYIDGNSDGIIQVHELTSAQDPITPAWPTGTPTETTDRIFHIGTIRGFSPIPSVENEGPAGVALITTGGGIPSGGEIGFIEWEGDVGGVVTVDPDPTDELDAYLGSLSVGLNMQDPFVDEDAFTAADVSPTGVYNDPGPEPLVIQNSDLGYVDIQGDIGFVRMHHLQSYDPYNPHAGFGHIPISVFMGEALPNAPLVVPTDYDDPEGEDFNLQGIFVTRNILGAAIGESQVAVITRDTVPDSIASHGEELLADFIWDSAIGVRTADISSVIAGSNIQGDIAADGKIWDNLFAGYFCGGSMGYIDNNPINISAINTDPLNPAPGLALIDPSLLFFIPGNGTGDIGGDLAFYTFNPLAPVITYGILINDGFYDYLNPGGDENDDTDTFLNPFEAMVNKDWRSEDWNPFPASVGFTPGTDELELEDYVGASERVYATLFADRDINANMIAGEKWISGPGGPAPAAPAPAAPAPAAPAPAAPAPAPAPAPGGDSIVANRDINGHVLAGSDIIADITADADADKIGALRGSIIAGLASQTSLDYLFNFLPDSTGLDLDPSGDVALFYGPGITDTMYNPLHNYVQNETQENNTLATADPLLGLGGVYLNPVSSDPNAVGGVNDPRATRVVGEIEEGDIDTYSFFAQIGDTIVVTVVADRVGTYGTGLNPWIQLTAPDGQLIATSDLASLNGDPIFEITLPVTGDEAVQGKWYITVTGLEFIGGEPNFTTGDYCLDVFILPPSNLLTGNILSEGGDGGTISGAYVGSYTIVDNPQDGEIFVPTQVIQAGSRASITGFTDLVPVGSFTNEFIIEAFGLFDFLNFEGSLGSIGQPIVSTGGIGGGFANYFPLHDPTLTPDFYPLYVIDTDYGLDGDIFSQDIRAIGGDIVKVHAAEDIAGWSANPMGVGININDMYSEISAIKYGGLFISTFTNVLGIDIPPLTAGTSHGGTIFEVSAGNNIGFQTVNLPPDSIFIAGLDIKASDNIYLVKAGEDIAFVGIYTDTLPLPGFLVGAGQLGSALPDEIGGLGLAIAGDDIGVSTFILGGAFAEDTAIPGSYQFYLPNGNPTSIAGVGIDRTTEIAQTTIDDPTVPAGFAFGQIIAGGGLGELGIYAKGDGGYLAAEGDMIFQIEVELGGVAIDLDGLTDTTPEEQYEIKAEGTLYHVYAAKGIYSSEFDVTGHFILMRSGGEIENVSIYTDEDWTPLYFIDPPKWADDGVGAFGIMVAKYDIENVLIDADGAFAKDFSVPADMPAIANAPDEAELFDPVLPAGTSIGVVIARGEDAELDEGVDEEPIDNLTAYADGDMLLVWAMTGNIENSFLQADRDIFAIQAGPQEATGSLITLEMFEDIVETTIEAGRHVYLVRAFDDIIETDIYADSEYTWDPVNTEWDFDPDGVGAIGMVIAYDEFDGEWDGPPSDIVAFGTFDETTDFAAKMPQVVKDLLGPTDEMVFEDRRGVIRELTTLTSPTFIGDVAIGWVIALGQESHEVDDDNHGIDDYNISGGGDIALVDAVFAEIRESRIIARGSSIYRVHAGEDIDLDSIDIIADDHIIELEAEDDIRGSGGIDVDDDGDSVGGLGSMIAGGGIYIDEIDVDGSFVKGTFPTVAQAALMFPSYAKGTDDGVTGKADIISTFASSGMVESRDPVVTFHRTGSPAIFTQDVTYAPVARALDSFQTEPVVSLYHGDYWKTIGYSIVSIISIGTFDIELDGLDDLSFNDIRADRITADGPIDAVVAEKGQIDLSDGLIDSDDGDDEVPQGGINFVFSGEEMDDLTIHVEKGNLGVVATRFDMEDMTIDVDRRGGPMPFVGGNIAIVWAYNDMENVDIYADGAVTGDVSTGVEMVDVFISADLYVDGVFAGQNMINVDVEVDGVDPATNGWDPAGRDKALVLFPTIQSDSPVGVLFPDETIQSGDLIEVRAGNRIDEQSSFYAFHDINIVSAGNQIGLPGQPVPIWAYTGDIDLVAAYGLGVNADIRAGGILASSPVFILQDGSKVYTLDRNDTAGQPTYFGGAQMIVIANQGNNPRIGLAGVKSDSTTYLNLVTSSTALWDVAFIDVDPFYSIDVAEWTTEDDNIAKAPDGFAEQNIHQLRIEGNLVKLPAEGEESDNGIDFDSGLAPDNIGDVGYIFIEGSVASVIQVESLGVFGTGSAPLIAFPPQALSFETGALAPIFFITELHYAGTNDYDKDNVTNVTSPILVSDQKGATTNIYNLDFDGGSAYYWTKSASAQFGEAFYVMALTNGPEVKGIVSYVKASEPVYPVGAVNFGSTPIAAFVSTRGVLSVESGNLLSSVGDGGNPGVIATLGSLGGVKINGNVMGEEVAFDLGDMNPAMILAFGGDLGLVSGVQVTGYVSNAFIAAVGGSTENLIFFLSGGVDGGGPIDQYFLARATIGKGGDVGDVTVGGQVFNSAILAVDGSLAASSNTITIGGDLDQSILLATDDVGDVIIGQDMEYAAIVSLTGSVGNVDVGGFMWFDLIGAIGGAIEYVYDIVDRLDILIGLFGDFQLDPVMDAYLASLAIDPTIANNVGNITVGRGEDDLGGFMDYVAILAFNGDIGSISVGGDMTHTAAVATGNVGAGNSITVDDDMFQDAIYALGGAIGDVTVGGYMEDTTLTAYGGYIDVVIDELDDDIHDIFDILGLEVLDSHLDSYIQPLDSEDAGNIGNVIVGRYVEDSNLLAGQDILSISTIEDFEDSYAVALRNIGPVAIGVYCEPAVFGSLLSSEIWAGASIGDISVNKDIRDSDIVAYTGSIGDISVGDDIGAYWYGHVNIFAEGGIGNIVVDDTIYGDVDIVAISGAIGDITVGGNVNKDPNDADGDGIFGGPSGGQDVLILAQQGIGNITIIEGYIQGNVIISAGVQPEVDGVDNVFDWPDVNFPDDPSDLRDFTNDVPFYTSFDANDLPALFNASIGNIEIKAGGIVANGQQDLIISATQNIGFIKTGTVVGLVDSVLAALNDIAIQAGGSIGVIDIGGSIGAYSNQVDFQAGGAIDGITVRGSITNNVDIRSASLAGLAVTGNMDGDFGGYTGDGIDILTGAITAYAGALTLAVPPAAILVGGSIQNDVNVSASSIGSGGYGVTVGYRGVGNINPGVKTINFVASGAGGNIGHITVRDQLGSSVSGGGDVNITSEDGAVGDIVAGRIGDPTYNGKINITAETAIGDIVAIDDALSGIRNLKLEVKNPFGRIGDLISHGNLTAADISSFIDLNTFDGSIGDLVSLVGYVHLQDITFGGSIGDIFASKDIEIADVWLEAGNLADDGAIGTNDTSLGVDQAVVVKDGLNRNRYAGAPTDGITSEISYVDIEDIRVFGNVGNITAFKEVELDDIEVGGNIGDITSINAEVEIATEGFFGGIFSEFNVGGNVGDIKAFLNVEIGPDNEYFYGLESGVNIGGDLGSIESEAAGVFLNNFDVVGNVGDVTAFQLIEINDLDVGGDVGDITSLNEDIEIANDTDITGSIGDISAADYIGIYDLEVAGGIGDITAGDGIYVEDTFVGGSIGDIYGVSQGEVGVDFENVHILGDVGDVTGESQDQDGVEWDNVVIDGSVGDVYGKSGDDSGIDWEDVLIGGSVGDITGISQDGEGIYFEGINILGSLGNIAGTSQDEEGIYWEDVLIGGDVGNVTGVSQDADGVDWQYVLIGGDVGDVTGEAGGDGYEGIDWYEVVIDGSVGDVFGKAEDDYGILWEDVLVQGDVGDITAICSDTSAIYFDYVTVGGDVGDIISLARDIELYDMQVGGSVGDIIANAGGSIYIDYLTAGNNIGDIVAGWEIEAHVLATAGNIGNIAAYGAGIFESSFVAGNDIGDVVALNGSIIDVDIHANRNIGDVYASLDIGASGGIDGSGGSDYVNVSITAETGNIGDGVVYVGNEEEARNNLPGGVVSAAGDIRALIHAGFDLYGVWAMKPSFFEPTDSTELVYGGNILDGTRITAGHDIGKIFKDSSGNIVPNPDHPFFPTYDNNRGVIAGGAIEDDVVIIAGNHIGKIEAKLIGFGSLEIAYTSVPVGYHSHTRDIEISVIKIQVPDNDGRFDNNDFLMFTDVNGDGIIDVPTELAEAIAAVDEEGASGGGDYIPVLADSKISDPEFDRIVDWWGREIGTTPDPEDREAFEDFINFRVGEVEVEDVDNIVIFKLEGYYDQFDIYDSFGNLNADGKPDGIFLDGNGNNVLDIDEDGNPEYGDQIVTFNYDVPNLPLVFVDHIIFEETYYHIDYETVPYYVENPALLTIIAQGKDPSSALINNGRAIGSIESTHDIYSNVLVEASRGGIGEVIASNNLGYYGSTEAVALKARTAIDTIYAGNYIGRQDTWVRIDVAGSGPGDIITLAMLQGNFENTWLAKNGVGVKGGIIAGAGDIRMDIDSGASIGAVQANVGYVYGDYHATGNLKSVYGSLGVGGDFIAELGAIDFVASPAGDIDATIIAGKSIGSIWAPFGDISGQIFSGGGIGSIVEGGDDEGGDLAISFKLLEGGVISIPSLNVTFDLFDNNSGPSAYALIQTNDELDISSINIYNSSSSTEFSIHTAGTLFSLDSLVVYGDFGDLTDGLGGPADANIGTVAIAGTIYGNVAVDGAIGTVTAAGMDEDGKVETTVKHSTTFTYTIGGVTDTVSPVGADWRVTVLPGNLIDATLVKKLLNSMTFTTTSSVDDLIAGLGGGNLDLNIGGDVEGTVALANGDVDLFVAGSVLCDGKVILVGGALEAITIGGDLAGQVASAGIPDDTVIVFIGGDLSGSLVAQGPMNAVVGGDFSGKLETVRDLILCIGGNLGSGDPEDPAEIIVHNGTIDLCVGGNLIPGIDIDADGGFEGIDIGGDIDPAVGHTYILDTDSKTAAPDKITIGSGQTVSIAGSSSNMVANVFVVFNSLVLDTTAYTSNGNGGTLIFSSDGSVRDIESAIGAPINIKGISVDGNAGDIIATGTTEECPACGAPPSAQKVSVENVNVSGSVGNIIGGKLVRNVLAQSTGLLVSLVGDVMDVNVYEDIEGIWAYRDAKNISAMGTIDSITAGRDIKIVKAGDLGSGIAGRNISNVYVAGDIGLLDAKGTIKSALAGDDIGTIKAIGDIQEVNAADDIERIVSGKNLKKIAAGGHILSVESGASASFISAGEEINVKAGQNAINITGASGTVFAGGYAKNISPNLEIESVGVAPVIII